MFTIAISIRNRSNTLRHCLRTCLSQDYKDLQVPVSDNCSTDALALATALVLVADASLITRASPVTPDPLPTQIAGQERLFEIGWKPAISLEQRLSRLAPSLSHS
jgi:hypothetical protein